MSHTYLEKQIAYKGYQHWECCQRNCWQMCLLHGVRKKITRVNDFSQVVGAYFWFIWFFWNFAPLGTSCMRHWKSSWNLLLHLRYVTFAICPLYSLLQMIYLWTNSLALSQNNALINHSNCTATISDAKVTCNCYPYLPVKYFLAPMAVPENDIYIDIVEEM